jgi:hypothetical protein
MTTFNTSSATTALSATDAGKKILATAEKNGCEIYEAIDAANRGYLGDDCQAVAKSIPSFWEEVEDDAAEIARKAAIAAREAEIVARREAITAAVVIAIQSGRCMVKDTGTDSVSETSICGKDGRAVAVLPHYDARLGGLGFQELDTPAKAKAFIDAAAVNSGGLA